MSSEISLKSSAQNKEYYKQQTTLLSKALYHADLSRIQDLISAAHLEFTFEESWQLKIFNSIDFTDAEFLSLDKRLKKILYRTANNLNRTPLVARLNSLGMKRKADEILKPHIFSHFTDIATIHKQLENVLKHFMQTGILITECEFQAEILPDQWVKKSDFGRILGAIYLTEVIETLGLKQIKVPSKKAVVTCSVTDALSFRIGHSAKLMSVTSEQLSVYAKMIHPVQRYLTRDEIQELFTIIYASNYSDLNPENFILAADGVYIIDTEFKSFDKRIEWEKMGRFKLSISPDDQEWFFQLFHHYQQLPQRNTSFTTFDAAEMWIEDLPADQTKLRASFKKLMRQCKIVGSDHTRLCTILFADLHAN